MTWFGAGIPSKELSTSTKWWLVYWPRSNDAGDDIEYLRVEPAAALQHPDRLVYRIQGARSSYHDARYRVDLYSGIGFLHSQENFSKEFPEVRLTVETRLYEGCVAKEAKELAWAARERYCRTHPTARPIVRIFGDAALTSTQQPKEDVGSTTATTATAATTTTFEGAKSFSGSAGIGAGWSLPLTASEEGTTRVSLMAIARLGVKSLDDSKLDDQLPWQSFFGLRMQNENGHFEGAYAEIGFGKSAHFVGQESWRFKIDAAIPFNDPRTLGFAMRLELDRPTSKSYADDTTPRAVHGDIKVSLLAKIDIKRLFHLFGAGGGQ